MNRNKEYTMNCKIAAGFGLWLTAICLMPGVAFGAQDLTPAKHQAAPASSVPATTAPPATAPARASSAVSARAASQALGCLIEASSIVEVGASVIGVLESVNVERGDVVTRGQVLARLETGVERAAVALALTKANTNADVESAQSQKTFAAGKARRTAELTELKFVSVQAREQADTEASMAAMRLAQTLEQQLLSARELQLARAQLAQRTIASPLNGVVVERYMSAGERVENRPIVKVAQLDPLRVELVLPSSEFSRIRTGMTARVQPALPGIAAQNATVTIVDRVIDAASNTFRARLALPNKDLLLPSGVRCKVEFDAALPVEANLAAPVASAAAGR